MRRLLIQFGLFLLVVSLSAQTRRVVPAAQWTFDHAPETISFRKQQAVFPIQWLAYKDGIDWYNPDGSLLQHQDRTAGDSIMVSPLGKFMGLMLVASGDEENSPRQVVSLRIFGEGGEPRFTHTQALGALEPLPAYQISDAGRLLAADRAAGICQEIDVQGVLWSESLAKYFPPTVKLLDTQVKRLGGLGKRLIAASLHQRGREDSLFTWLRAIDVGDSSRDGGLAGEMVHWTTIPASSYSFLELANGEQRMVYLLDELLAVEAYPWGTWTCKPVNPGTAFMITDSELLVINLGDGMVTARIRPYDLYQVSDALFIPGPDIFLVLRYEPFFRDGQLAYRNFELNGMEKNGRIIYRGSFGAWSPTLPHLYALSGQRFAIHLHNAVLLYEIVDG